MPNLSEIKRGKEIGRVTKNRSSKYIKYMWCACPDCGKERWVTLLRGNPDSLRCCACSMKTLEQLAIRRARNGDKAANWKGGRKKSRGYILVKLQPSDFYFAMADSESYVREHRLVVAKALGRCLHPWEIVHHKKGCAKDDNRYPDTLELVSDVGHKQITLWEQKLDKVLQKQQELFIEIRFLRLENKQLREELLKCRLA